LVARLRWCEPFGLAPGGELGGELGDGLDAVLHVRHGGGHRFELVDTTSGGQVVALTSSAHGGHQVVSVIGIDGSAPAGDIHRGALEVTSGDVPGTDWWALPIAEGPVLSVTETVVVSDVDEDQLVVHGYLPAWEGSNSMLLSSSTAPGVGAALAALAAVAGGGDESQATQSAVARFGQYGFEAAAVTTFSVGRAPRMHTGDLVHEVRRRVVTLRFSHPYAVVAVGGTGAFASVPLFSAWVGTGCAVG
jgi:hypothetical protein